MCQFGSLGHVAHTPLRQETVIAACLTSTAYTVCHTYIASGPCSSCTSEDSAPGPWRNTRRPGWLMLGIWRKSRAHPATASSSRPGSRTTLLPGGGRTICWHRSLCLEGDSRRRGCHRGTQRLRMPAKVGTCTAVALSSGRIGTHQGAPQASKRDVLLPREQSFYRSLLAQPFSERLQGRRLQA